MFYIILMNGEKFFYRSSWELKILEQLNILLKEEKIEYVKVPEKILFYINKYRHYYFLDIEYKLFEYDRKILEIKPSSKLNENKIKLESGKEKYGKNFIIITETEIFNNDLKNKLIEYGKV